MKKLIFLFLVCIINTTMMALPTNKIVDNMSYSSYERYRVTAETETDFNGRSFTIDLVVEGYISPYGSSVISKVTYGNEIISYYRDMSSDNYYVYVQYKKFYFRF